MSKRFLCMMMLIGPLFSLAQSSVKEINWITGLSWEQVKQKAKEENKFIFIDAYATWCAPCKKMDKEVYTNDTVADFFNERFISFKLQMDSTARDNSEVKSLYAFAKKISNDYKVTGFPTLLFFSTDGVLTGKELGFRNSSVLIQSAEVAMSPERVVRHRQLERYKAGEKDYSSMKDLAIFTVNILGDRNLAKQIANDYIAHLHSQDLVNIPMIYFIRDVARNYKLSEDQARKYNEYLLQSLPGSLYERTNLDFFNNYYQIIPIQSRIFELLKTDSTKIDSIMNNKGWTRALLRDIVYKNALVDRLVKNGKPISGGEPDWVKIRSEMRSKYSFLNVDKLVLDFQIDYYRGVKLDWKKWAAYKQQRIDKWPPPPHNSVAISRELNDGGAWDAFLNCNDKDVLRKTLTWTDLAIKLYKQANPKGYPFYNLDTKANVLYKIGRISDAIKVQNEVIRQVELWIRDFEDKEMAGETLKEYKEILQKMKSGKPTYVEQGAKWNNNTLPKSKIK